MPCWYCGVRLRKGGIFQKTKDHVVPKSKGGIWTVDACYRCNQEKKDMSVEQFRRLRGGVEFYGEMGERLAREATAWLVPDNPNVVHYQSRSIMPEVGERPTYKPVVDLSKIKQYERGAITKQERKAKKTGHIPPDLLGVKFGLLTVVRRMVGKWEVECLCGSIENRSSKAVLNPANSCDACVECRRIVGKLRNDIFHEMGVDVDYEDCFRYVFGKYLPGQEETCSINTSIAGIADANSLEQESVYLTREP